MVIAGFNQNLNYPVSREAPILDADSGALTAAISVWPYDCSCRYNVSLF